MKHTIFNLYHYIQNEDNRKDMIEQSLKPSVIETYYSNTKQSYTNGYFYLGGHLPIQLQQEITPKHIETVKQINQQQNGNENMANSWEYQSSIAHEITFNEFVRIIEYFYNKK